MDYEGIRRDLEGRRTKNVVGSRKSRSSIVELGERCWAVERIIE